MPNRTITTLQTNQFQPSDVVVARIQNRRGNRVNLPQPLAPGELGWCLDSRQLFIGLTEEEATAGLEIYRGGVSNAQSITQSYMDRNIVEFDTIWMRLNAVIQLVQDNEISSSEEALLAELRQIPSSIFVDPQKRAIVEEIELNIESITNLNAAVLTSLVGSYNDPNNGGAPLSYDFTDQALITYDWITADPVPAEITITATGGVVDGITTIDNPGLGYIPDTGSSITLAVQIGTGSGATFSAIVSAEGELSSFTVLTGGTGYTNGETLTLEDPTQRAIQGTATIDPGTQIIAGIIQQVTLTDPNGAASITTGIGYAGVPTVSFEDGTGSGATADAIINVNGEIIGINMTDGGTNYTAPTVVIQAPQSETMYKFKYDVGVDDQDLLQFSVIEALPTTVEDYFKLSNMIIALDGYLFPSGVDPIPASGVGVFGNNPMVSPPGTDGWLFYPRGNTMVDGALYTTTARQASNIAAIVNSLSDLDSGLITTKQNVEILTEFSAQTLITDILFSDPIEYELNDSAGNWQVVTNTPPIGTGNLPYLPLEYDVTLSDVEFLSYSTSVGTGNPGFGNSTVGTLKVIYNDSADPVTALSDESVEVRGTSLTPLNAGGEDIEFRSTYNAGIVSVEYKHDFGVPLTLKVTSRRWKSF